MTDFLAAPNVLSIAIFSLLLLGVVVLVAFMKKLSIKQCVIIGVVSFALAVILTGLSYFVTYHWEGGTVNWIYRGWPHFFHIAGTDLDGTEIAPHFNLGPVYSYLLVNILFYFVAVSALQLPIFLLLRKSKPLDQAS